jgi:pro-apoptotic serine protease NMA111
MNGTNNAQCGKCKQHSGSEAERRPKQLRAVNGTESAGENTPEVTSILDQEEPRVVPGLADTAEWQAAIEKVVRNVVSIHFCQTCAFDTDPGLTSEGTGFVVDAERG